MKIIQSNKMYTAITGFVSKLVIAFSQFIAIKLVTQTLGIESYAVFAILTGMIGWYMLAELGLGPAIQNYVSKMKVVNKDYSNTIATLFLSIVGVWLVFVVILFFIKDFIGEILLVQFDIASHSKGDFFFLVSSLYTSSVIFSIAYKVWFSEGQGYLSNLFQLAASLLGLIALAIVLNIDYVDDKLFLSLFAFVCPLAILPFIVFIYRIRNWRINVQVLESFFKEVGFKVLVKFWLLAILAMLVVQVDIFIISQLSESSEIVTYVITSKVFTLAYFIYASYMQMLWPVFSEKLHGSKWNEVNLLIFNNIMIFMAIYIVGFIGLYFLLDIVLEILTSSDKFIVPNSLFVGFVLLTLVRVWTDMYATLLQSINELDFFIYAIALQALISVVFQWQLTTQFGIDGVVYGMLVSYLLTVSWVLPARYYYLYRRNKLIQVG